MNRNDMNEFEARRLYDSKIKPHVRVRRGCHLFTKGKGDSRGTCSVHDEFGKVQRVNRVAFAAFHGGILGNEDVLFSCSNPTCVNPDCLKKETRKS